MTCHDRAARTGEPAADDAFVRDLREQVKELEAMLHSVRRETIREVLDLMVVEGENFYFNESNDYGAITMRLFTGSGDPWRQYAGEACKSLYAGGVWRENGTYRLSERLVHRIEEMLQEQRASRRS